MKEMTAWNQAMPSTSHSSRFKLVRLAYVLDTSVMLTILHAKYRESQKKQQIASPIGLTGTAAMTGWSAFSRAAALMLFR